MGAAGDVWQTLEGEDPGTGKKASVSETLLILAHSLPPRILRKKKKKNSNIWGKSICTHKIHTDSQYLHFKFLFCEMAWEKLAERFPGELGIFPSFPVRQSVIGLPAPQTQSKLSHKGREMKEHGNTQHTGDTCSNTFFKQPKHLFWIFWFVWVPFKIYQNVTKTRLQAHTNTCTPALSLH